MTRSMPGRPPPQVRLDRPFFFAIIDVDNLSTLFVGRVTAPELLDMPEVAGGKGGYKGHGGPPMGRAGKIEL